MNWQPKGAAAKLAYIQSNIANPDKTGHNAFHKFDYVQEHGIIELLRPLLKELHCSVVPSPAAVEVRVDDAQTGKGKSQKLVTLVGELTFTDTDEPADSLDRTIVARFTGAGADDLDKAHAKAQTIFTKYALQKFFLIPTEKIEDGDATPAPEAPARAPRKSSGGAKTSASAPESPPKDKADTEPSPPGGTPATVTPAHVDRIVALAKSKGKDKAWMELALVSEGADPGSDVKVALAGCTVEQLVHIGDALGVSVGEVFGVE